MRIPLARREPARLPLLLLLAFSILAVSVSPTISSSSPSHTLFLFTSGPISAAFATDIGDLLDKYHDAPYFGHHYDPESKTYKDDSGNEFECQPSEDKSVYYYEYMGEYWKCTYEVDEGGEGVGGGKESGGGQTATGEQPSDDSKDNTEGSSSSSGDIQDDNGQGNNDGSPHYYSNHIIGHYYDSKAKSYVDADGVEYKCHYSHDGKVYYKFNGDYYGCDELDKPHERHHVGWPYKGHKYDAKKDAYFDEEGNVFPCNHKYRGVYYYEFEGDFWWCEEKST